MSRRAVSSVFGGLVDRFGWRLRADLSKRNAEEDGFVPNPWDFTFDAFFGW